MNYIQQLQQDLQQAVNSLQYLLSKEARRMSRETFKEEYASDLELITRVKGRKKDD